MNKAWLLLLLLLVFLFGCEPAPPEVFRECKVPEGTHFVIYSDTTGDYAVRWVTGNNVPCASTVLPLPFDNEIPGVIATGLVSASMTWTSDGASGLGYFKCSINGQPLQTCSFAITVKY